MAYFYIINFNLSFPQHPLYWSEAGIMGCNPLPRHESLANYNYQAELGKFYCFMTGRKLRNCTIQEICSQRSQPGFEVTKTIKQKQRVNIALVFASTLSFFSQQTLVVNANMYPELQTDWPNTEAVKTRSKYPSPSPQWTRREIPRQS